MLSHEKSSVTEMALEKAAKIICNCKCGLCPIREENFSGCPYVCDEDIRPWRCWVAYLQEVSGGTVAR